MVDAHDIAASLIGSFHAAECGRAPYPHWLPKEMLPRDALREIDALPFAAPVIGETQGKRETHNTTRAFFGAEARERYSVCEAMAAALQSRPVVAQLESLCEVRLAESFLRIEYCLDVDGFWLEPHTDIGAKLFTMLIYISEGPGSEAWGTDILDADLNLVAVTPYRRNDGLIFIPSDHSWHGFHRRPIEGVRRSLIVNYVRPEWRSRQELAYPDRTAGT